MLQNNTPLRKVHHLIAIWLSCLFCALPALSQTKSASPSPVAVPEQTNNQPLPNLARYRLFFKHVVAMQQLADDREKAGNTKSAEGWRTHDQRLAGLTQEEGNLLKQVATECVNGLSERDTEIAKIYSGARSSGGPSSSDLGTLRELRAEKETVLQSHIDSIRVALGESSFSKLDTYVTALFNSATITRVPVNPPGSSTRRTRRATRELTDGGQQ